MSKIPDHFSVIGPTIHPLSGESGILLRSRTTGTYSFLVGEKYGGIPYQFAQEFSASVGKPADELQDACIKRMEELKLTPFQVSKLLPDVGQAHVMDYLTRKKSMGSHKVCALIKALGLEVKPKTRIPVES
jgi:hypothetical protein